MTFREPDGSTSLGRIDLYKRGCFVLEAKQSRRPGAAKAIPEQGDLLAGHEPPAGQRGKRVVAPGWDVLMMRARQQAEDYAKALPVVRRMAAIPHCLRRRPLSRDLRRLQRAREKLCAVPRSAGLRIFLEDLRDDAVRERLRRIWLDPLELDPAKAAAEATRAIAARLAQVSKHLEEARGADGKPLYDPEAVALFLMRCLFTMFAEDVELLPKRSFRDLLAKCVDNPAVFPRMVGQLWEAMDTGGFSFALEREVKKFNGYLFKNRTAFPLPREEIGELLARQPAPTGARSSRPSSARCWNRRSTPTSAAGSAPITRRAPMSNGSSSQR